MHSDQTLRSQASWREVPWVDPVSCAPLASETDGQGRSWLVAAQGGARYPVVDGVPRLVPGVDVQQQSTSDSFGFKWSRTDSYSSMGMQDVTVAWYLEKYGFASLAEWAAQFQGRRTLDVGCGCAYSARLWLDAVEWKEGSLYVGADISSAVDVAKQRLQHHRHIALVQADALQLPFPDGHFDCIFSEGVLHHTPSTRAAILSSSRVLRPGGRIFFYVYKKKAPIREWVDDYIRESISTMSDERAWEEMRNLTLLGQALHATQATITLEKPIALLGLPEGTFNLQRFFYNHMAKTFWNEKMSFEENVHINFDWYRPLYCHRQTPEQVAQWCSEGGLGVERLHVDDSGITVIATKGTRAGEKSP